MLILNFIPSMDNLENNAIDILKIQNPLKDTVFKYLQCFMCILYIVYGEM